RIRSRPFGDIEERRKTVVDRVFFQERQQMIPKGRAVLRLAVGPQGLATIGTKRRWHEPAVLTAGVVDGQAELPQVIKTRNSVRSLADLLDRGEEQPDEHADDGNHDEQFNQRKATPVPMEDEGHVATLSN